MELVSDLIKLASIIRLALQKWEKSEEKNYKLYPINCYLCLPKNKFPYWTLVWNCKRQFTNAWVCVCCLEPWHFRAWWIHNLYHFYFTFVKLTDVMWIWSLQENGSQVEMKTHKKLAMNQMVTRWLQHIHRSKENIQVSYSKYLVCLLNKVLGLWMKQWRTRFLTKYMIFHLDLIFSVSFYCNINKMSQSKQIVFFEDPFLEISNITHVCYASNLFKIHGQVFNERKWKKNENLNCISKWHCIIFIWLSSFTKFWYFLGFQTI